MNLIRYLYHRLHIFATIAPPGGVHIFAWPASFRKFAPRACIFSHTIPVWQFRDARVPHTQTQRYLGTVYWR